MRLKKYLISETRAKKPDKVDTVYIESYAEKNREEITEIGLMIKKDCKDFLKQSRGGVLWRGASQVTGVWDERETRTDRYPKDTPSEIHDLLNDEFDSVFGWRAREEGVFCTGKYDQASSYGNNVYSIWPIGRFKFLYHPHVDDLYTHLTPYIEQYDGDSFDEDYAQETYNELYGEGEDGAWSYDGDTTEENDRSEAEDVAMGWIKDKWMKVNTEAIEHFENDDDEWFEENGLNKDDYDPDEEQNWSGDFYDGDLEWEPAIDYDGWVIDFAEEQRETSYEGLEDEISSIVSSFQDRDLVKAIKSENEVTLGCKRYYLVRENATSDVWDTAYFDDTKQIKLPFKFQPNSKYNKGVLKFPVGDAGKGHRFFAGVVSIRTKKLIATYTHEEFKKAKLDWRKLLGAEGFGEFFKGKVIIFSITFTGPTHINFIIPTGMPMDDHNKLIDMNFGTQLRLEKKLLTKFKLQ